MENQYDKARKKHERRLGEHEEMYHGLEADPEIAGEQLTQDILTMLALKIIQIRGIIQHLRRENAPDHDREHTDE